MWRDDEDPAGDLGAGQAEVVDDGSLRRNQADRIQDECRNAGPDCRPVQVARIATPDRMWLPADASQHAAAWEECNGHRTRLSFWRLCVIPEKSDRGSDFCDAW